MASDMYTWAAEAAPGDRITYFIGHLAYAREMATMAVKVNGVAAVRPPELDFAADALELAESGHVLLVQRRIGPNKWDYEAVRTRKAMRARMKVAA